MINKDVENKLLLIKGTVQIGNTFAVDNLIDKIIKTGNINSLSSANKSLLHFFAMQPNREDLLLVSEELIKNGIDINLIDIDERTALHECVIFNNVEMIKLLLKYGVDVSIRDGKCWTAYKMASYYGNFKIMKLLDANRKVVINEGLMQLLFQSRFDIGSVDYGFLLDDFFEKKDLNVVDEYGCSLLQWNVSKNDSLITVEELLKSGVDVNSIDFVCGMTPLIVATKLNKIDMVKLLLKYEADADIKDKDGFSALDYAIKFDDEELINILESVSNLNEKFKKALSM